MESKVKNLTTACWIMGFALVAALGYIGWQVYTAYKAEKELEA